MSNAIKQRDFRGLVLPVAFLALWWLVTAQGWVNTKLIVPPLGVVQTAATTLADPDFYAGVALSLGRDLSGFVVGAVGGIALGVLLAVSRWADRLIGPTFHTVRQISLFAWLPMLTSWLGYGDLSKVVFIALSAFYPVVLGTFEGVKSVTQAQGEVAKVYGFTRTQVLFRLILPAASPQILTGLNLGLVYAWLATIGSEFLLANWGNGLGNIVFKGRAAFNVELIIVGMLAIGLVGTVFNRLATRLEQHSLRWRGPQA
jgi:sulfonate transport system permease protein